MDITKQLATLSIDENIRGTPIFIHGSSERQYALAFPKHVMDYIIANPKSPKQWKKLIQTCKLFFDRNPVVIISCLNYFGHSCFRKPEGWKTCSTAPCNGRHERAINFVDSPLKLWLTEDLIVDCASITTTLLPHLFKCDVKKITLFNDVLSSEVLSFLTSTVANAFITGIKDNRGKEFPFEELIEALPACTEAVTFIFHRENWTSNTFKKIAEMKHLQNLRKIVLFGQISTTFDFDDLFKFMLEHKQINFVIDLGLSSAAEEYTGKFKAAAQKIQLEHYGAHRRPNIHLNGVSLIKNQ